jgi:peptide/nickel transport system permease protein
MRRNFRITLGVALLGTLVVIALAAPLIAPDPLAFKTINRLRPPSATFWFGTDNYGRSVYARTVYGGRISLLVGACVALISVVFGLAIGLVAGYYRRVDGFIMRIMDGIMAIPAILLAIALVSLTGAGVTTVIGAIVFPEVPRVVRLVRGVVLTIRDLAFVDAAIASGTAGLQMLWRHILPNALAPLIVQASYVAASAILIESALSFLGLGTPPSIPTWGNMIASGRGFLTIAPWMIVFPGVSLAIAVLAVNLLGDGLRDRLDPRLSHRLRG